MLKLQHKSLLLLLLFCFFLSEYLTWSTLALSALGAILIYLNIKLPKLYRNLMVLGIFASYWIVYGKVIDPEVGLNFLTSVIVLKMLEKESRRDQYMIFFGLILLFSTGALFEKNLTYAAFYGISFLLLIADFYQELLIRVRLKDLFISLLWVLPLTTALFFLAPRMMNPLPFKSSAPEQGEVGYTPDVNLTEIDQLAGNDEPVFQALVPSEIPQSQLYWRGNVLSYNDGWNWTGLQERLASIKLEPQMTFRGLRQEIQLMGSHSYFFGLDRPNAFLYQGEVRMAGGTHSHSQQSNRNILSYEVVSNPQIANPVIEGRSTNTKTMLSRQDKEWILNTFTASTLEGVIREVQNYFRINRFTYSLSPGRSFSFQSFMRERRIGYCSHFASSLGLILRVKGYPTRLVSGFMGGRFNQYGSYYLITQNDAHAWVEAIHDGKWIRLDPTEWIAPDRIRLGGEAYAGANAPAGTLAALGFKLNLSWLQDIKLWFNQWDFRFYRWLDQMDYQGQLQFLSSLKIKRQWLYTIVPLIIFSFAFLYLWQMARSKSPSVSDLEEIWQLFLKKASARGLMLNRVSLKAGETQIQNWQHPDQGKLLTLFQKLCRLSFDKNDSGTLKGLRNELKKF